MSYRLDNLVAGCPILPKYLFWSNRVNGGLLVGFRRTLSAHVTLWLVSGGDTCACCILLVVFRNRISVPPVAGSDLGPGAGSKMGPANILGTTKHENYNYVQANCNFKNENSGKNL